MAAPLQMSYDALDDLQLAISSLLDHEELATQGATVDGLGVALFQPVPGESAGLHYTWSFGNTGIGPKTIRVIFFMDVDCYLATNDYADDMCVRLANTFGSGGSAIAVGQGTAHGKQINQRSADSELAMLVHRIDAAIAGRFKASAHLLDIELLTNIQHQARAEQETLGRQPV